MRSYCRLFVLISILSASAMSCVEKTKVSKTMSRFIESEIIIPNDLDCIYKRDVNKIRKDLLKPFKYIIYYDSLDCTSCKMAHLANIYPLYEMADTCNFSVLTIFSPQKSQIDTLRLQLILSNYPFPVYIDGTGTFIKENIAIPSDKRFHSFLVDDNYVPIYVGNPLANDRLMELFITLLTNQ